MVAGQSRCARLEITFFRLLYHKPHFSFLCMALEEGTRIIFIELYTRTSKIGYVIAFNGSQGWTSWSRKLKVQLQFRSWTRAKGKHERIIAAKCSGTATTRARYRTIARQILGTVNNSVTMGGPLRYVRSDVHRCKVVAPRYYIVYPRGWLFLKHTQDGTDSTPKNCYVRARTIRVRKSWKKKRTLTSLVVRSSQRHAANSVQRRVSWRDASWDHRLHHRETSNFQEDRPFDGSN